jgi:Cell division protein
LKSAPKPINGYVVQIGSFKKNTDADAVKAKLTLNGFNAKIEPIKLLDGEVRHKVILGPFKTEKQAQLMQQQLKTLKIDSIRAAI